MPGESKTAIAPIVAKPAGMSCEAELFLGPDESTKVVSSGRVPFVSTGASQNVRLPITMPSSPGTLKGYIDIFAAGMRFLAYKTVEDIAVAPGLGSVSGLVRDFYTGNPISNVRVEVDGLVAYTTTNGRFAFILREGTYTITFAKTGYTTVTDVLWITAGREETLSTSMKGPEPPPPPPEHSPEDEALVALFMKTFYETHGHTFTCGESGEDEFNCVLDTASLWKTKSCQFGESTWGLPLYPYC
ncbi:hypothetical protein ES703_66809 [subsurface metagenome]